MAKFKFGKNKKDSREDELKDTKQNIDSESEEFDLEELHTEDRNTRYQDSGEDISDTFFDDDFDTVDEQQYTEDLDTRADEYVAEVTQDDYSGTEPKWYEKVTNIIIAIVIVVVLTVTGLYVFREPIRNIVGSSTEDIRNYDLQGELVQYGEGVQGSLKGEEEVEEEVIEYEVELVDFVSDGEYVVGKDINAGVWIADEVLVEVYASEEDFNDNQSPVYTNVSSVDIQLMVNLYDGDYVVVQKGNLVYNDTRPLIPVNIGDTLMLEDEHQLEVGKDFPEGFYTLYNLDVLELMDDGRVRDATLKALNAGEEEQNAYGVERKTTVFLRNGLTLEVDGELIAERVSSDGTYGGDLDLLMEMTEEESDDETTEEGSQTDRTGVMSDTEDEE